MRALFLTGLALTSLTSAPAPARTMDAARQEITRTEDDWREARIAGDTAFLGWCDEMVVGSL